MVVLAPSGDIAIQQRDLVVVSTLLMLIIVVPVICLVLLFAWRYRASNTSARYDPEWHHSTGLEVAIWSAPLMIIIALGAITWVSTHKLDPYRPLDRIEAAKPIPADAKPLRVEVVALDWKWLFFYPDYGVATVNEMAAPVDTPIDFKLTASSVMNSFYVPALAGMIYAMPGMQTRLHAVINKPGDYEGMSSNYSGAGFSHMRFKFRGLDQAGFDQWIAGVKQAGTMLNRDSYAKLQKPSIKEPVRYYGAVENGLYEAVLNLCARPGQMCMNEMAHIDRMGGAGVDSRENRDRLEYDSRQAPADVAPAPEASAPEAAAPATAAPGAGTPAAAPAPAETMEPMNHDMHNMNSTQ